MLLTIPERLSKIDPFPPTVTANEAAKVICQGGLLIDVREPEEYATSPVKDAINIPRGVIEMKLLNLAKDADTPIFLHCASSARAALAAEQLMKMGYTKVSVVTCEVPTIQAAFCN